MSCLLLVWTNFSPHLCGPFNASCFVMGSTQDHLNDMLLSAHAILCTSIAATGFCGSLRWMKCRQMVYFLYSLMLPAFGPHLDAWQVIHAWACQMEGDLQHIGFSYLSHGTHIDVVLLQLFFFPATNDWNKKENGKKEGKQFSALVDPTCISLILFFYLFIGSKKLSWKHERASQIIS